VSKVRSSRLSTGEILRRKILRRLRMQLRATAIRELVRHLPYSKEFDRLRRGDRLFHAPDRWFRLSAQRTRDCCRRALTAGVVDEGRREVQPQASTDGAPDIPEERTARRPGTSLGQDAPVSREGRADAVPGRIQTLLSSGWTARVATSPPSSFMRPSYCFASRMWVEIRSISANVFHLRTHWASDPTQNTWRGETSDASEYQGISLMRISR